MAKKVINPLKRMAEIKEVQSQEKPNRPPKILSDAIGTLNTPDKNHMTLSEQMSPQQKTEFYKQILENVNPELIQNDDTLSSKKSGIDDDVNTVKKDKVKNVNVDNKLVKLIGNLSSENKLLARMNVHMTESDYKLFYDLKTSLKMKGHGKLSYFTFAEICVSAFKEKYKKQLEELGIKE